MVSIGRKTVHFLRLEHSLSHHTWLNSFDTPRTGHFLKAILNINTEITGVGSSRNFGSIGLFVYLGQVNRDRFFVGLFNHSTIETLPQLLILILRSIPLLLISTLGSVA